MMRKKANKYLGERLRDFWTLMRAGNNLGRALDLSGYDFPAPELVDDICAFVDFTDFDTKIAVVAAEWGNRGVERIVEIAQWFNRIFLSLSMGFVIYVVVGTNALQSQIASSVGH